MHVLFVAPTLSANTVHCLRSFLELADVRLGVVTHAPVDHMPSFAHGRLTGHYRVENALDPAQLVRAVRAFQGDVGPVDKLIGFLEHLQVPLAITRDLTGVRGISESTALNFRDKNRMKEVLRRAGLPVARQAIVHGEQELRAFVRAVGFPVVLKPIQGVGSQSTRKVATEDELLAAVAELHIQPAHPMQAEEFITGDERSFETAFVGGQPRWVSSTHYMNRPLEILENPWMQWCVILPREPMDEVATAFRPINTAALRALGMDDGLAHMEWFVRSDGSPVISEVGARPPGASFMTMMGHAHGVDMWARWAQLVTHGTWHIPDRQFAVGCAYLRGQGTGRRVVAIHGLDEAQQIMGQHVVDRRLPEVGALRSDSYEGDGWAIVRHPSTHVVREALLTLVRKVHVELG